ncbi:DUF5615 family PIN-like protein [Nocardia sp. NPDC051570]|uniref:DUF5615 family PIN-like protein n=1 Tax=Nocardia sp. NPDC051570 TaxID=3364324 RepID=UPI00379ADED3
MRFLIDAQLPRRLATFLETAGHDARHTLDLPQANRTPDGEIAAIADREGRTVVTKDSDFFIGHLLERSPRSLLIVVTATLPNKELIALFERHVHEIVCLLEESAVVELGRNGLVAHANRDPDSD